jgi:hypothetical protein
MKSSKDYIEEVKAKLGIESDYALAKWLGVTKQAASNWARGKNGLDDYAAARIAETLEINPLEVIAVANMERDKVSERREFWRRIAAGAALGVLVLLLDFQELNEGAGFFGLVESIHYAQLAKFFPIDPEEHRHAQKSSTLCPFPSGTLLREVETSHQPCESKP